MTDITDLVLAAINIFQDHPSIQNINKVEIKKIMKGMNLHKTCQLKDIPTKIIKMNADIFANFICLHFSYCIDIGEFPHVFKDADIITVSKKKEKSNKTN